MAGPIIPSRGDANAMQHVVFENKPKDRQLFSLAFACLLLGTSLLLGSVRVARGQAAIADAAARAEELFAVRILPVFQEKCFACHGADGEDVQADFNMLSRDGLLRGGESKQPAVVPGRPEESLLIQAVNWEGLEMPPKANDRLTDEQIAQLREWIASGAAWPDDTTIRRLQQAAKERWNDADGVLVKTSGGLSEAWTNRGYDPANLWAYQPLWTDPQGELARDDRNPIDVLIERRIASLGLRVAPPSDRVTLIRRATFDLLGLPPTPEEIAIFVHDSSSDEEAFAKVVERLLTSPHYGEQWGRHWLDVVRYADSSGYANDFERGNAWRYRDYIVRAFNNDKPYDVFIREQLAGDELDPDDPEMLVAVGFLRMGPWELTGMEVPRVARQRFLDDVTDAVGQVFLAHMLQCARCHDHKFDPVPTRDYYRLQAAFATTQLAEREAPFVAGENLSGFEEQARLRARAQQYRRQLDELATKQTIEAGRKWLRDLGRDTGPYETVVAEIAATGKDVELGQVRNLMAKRNIDPALIPSGKAGFEPQDFGMERIARKGIERLQWRLERYEPIALSVYSGHTPQLKSVLAPQRVPADPTAGELEQTCILAGGDPFSPTTPVAPAVISACATIRGEDEQAQLPTSVAGRRLALADWIASEQNPLTARVIVNRVWQWHFGQAIAGNPNNFGTTGKKPSHPRLLDLLATWFMEQGWSIKALHRLIMNSDTYRRSSDHPDPTGLLKLDSSGTSYAAFRPRRLAAEELRDAMLHISGELNPTLGGIPIRPEMNLEAALQPRMVMGTFAEAWQPSPRPAQRHRRSLYALQLRGQRDPFMEVFNAPTPDLSCEARDLSTVTPQVFSLFNSEITFDRALALAARVSKANLSRERAITDLFQLMYGRSATAEEVKLCLAHWSKMTARHETLHFAPPVYPREVRRTAVEENTGEKFSFVEPLEFYEDFVPDLKPADASPELRGLAELCLVLLNSNEFAYVY